jgi:hypothetical protein
MFLSIPKFNMTCPCSRVSKGGCGRCSMTGLGRSQPPSSTPRYAYTECPPMSPFKLPYRSSVLKHTAHQSARDYYAQSMSDVVIHLLLRCKLVGLACSRNGLACLARRRERTSRSLPLQWTGRMMRRYVCSQVEYSLGVSQHPKQNKMTVLQHPVKSKIPVIWMP